MKAPYTLPSESDESVLVEIPLMWVPIVGGLIGQLEERTVWASESDWEQAYPIVVEMERDLMGAGVKALIAEIRALRGVKLGETLDPEQIYTAETYPGTQLTDIVQRIKDAQGTIDAGWFGWGGRQATIADVVSSLRIGNEQAGNDIWEQIGGMLTGTGSIATIGNTLANLFGTAVDTVGEGGMLAVVIAASVANAAMMGAQAAQIDRLIASLDGGGLVGPSDNVLLALRGTSPATGDNNVTTKLEAIRALIQTQGEEPNEVADLLQQILTILG